MPAAGIDLPVIPVGVAEDGLMALPGTVAEAAGRGAPGPRGGADLSTGPARTRWEPQVCAPYRASLIAAQVKKKIGSSQGRKKIIEPFAINDKSCPLLHPFSTSSEIVGVTC